MTSALVLAEGLAKSYAGRAVLAGLDLEVAPGELVAVRGPNGVGKSTLLRVLAGLVLPEAGRVEIAGAPPALGRPEVAWMGPGERGLYWRLTVRQQLAFVAACRGTPAADEGERLVAQLGLEGREQTPVRQLSSGLRRRLGLACALLGGPRVLLLDEPAASLDDAGREALVGWLRDFLAGGEGRAVLVAAPEGLAGADRELGLEAAA